jgi:ERCC4-type nuclease
MISALIIDSREPPWCQNLRLAGVSPLVQELPTGDAWMAAADAAIIVERKTLSDLCSSIADGRLFNQAAEMRDVSDWAYVVVTSMPVVMGGKVVINHRATNWRWSSVQGALLTVQELGVSLVWCENDASYGATLESLARRSRQDVRIKARRQAVMESPAETLLSALPNIGAGKAEALLRDCTSAAWALDYLTSVNESDIEVNGIGPSTKEMARSALGLQETERLAVILRENWEELEDG